MDLPPEDPAAREEWLERWVMEQAEKGRLPGPEARPARIRTAIWKARMVPLRMQRRLAHGTQKLGDRLFDKQLGTMSHARLPEHEHPDRVPYVPSAWHVLPRALRYLGVSSSDSFVEFGCGKGRVLHQAAKRPFRRVIGVEISPELAEIARAALAARSHQHRCGSVEVVVSDVRDFRVPDDLTIGYLFHPVKNEALDAVLRRIIESLDRRRRRVRLIYVYPVQAERVLDTGRFRVLKKQRSRLFDVPTSETTIFESV